VSDDRYAAVVEAHFHLGELYFLLPFLSGIRYQAGERLCLLFSSRRLHDQFLAEPLLVRAAAELDADLVIVPARPARPLGEGRPVGRLARRLIQLAAWPARRRRIRAVLERTDLLITQIAQGFAEQALAGRVKRPVIARFPHTSSPQIMNITEARKQTFRQAAHGEPMLLLDPEARPYYELYGFRDFVILGYHALSEKWLAWVEEFAQHSGHAIVYSFTERDDILPAEHWEHLHRSTYRTIREVFPGIPIVIKPHPSQDLDRLRGFGEQEGWTGVEIVTEHPMVAASGARVCVSFLTGGIYNAMQLGIPSINYFTAHDAYIRGHGSYMHEFASLGALDVSDEEGLRRELERVRAGTVTQDFGERKKRIPRIGSFAEFRRRLGDSLNA
jgi:hypothetical protein